MICAPCRQSKSRPCASAPATGAACSSRTCPASNGATARWAAPRWKGVRLKDILDKAGLKKETIEIGFTGADGPVSDKTPDFVKSIPAWKAIEDTTIVAYEMNGAPLPHFNGFPARVIVPGWTATYWMKHVTSISALTKPESSFWMAGAYRIPLGKFPIVAHFASQETAGEHADHRDGGQLADREPRRWRQRARRRPACQCGGIAWDAGYGISVVEVSRDGGKTWTAATLGEDIGRFAFRPWSFNFTPAAGKQSITVRASNKVGQTQTPELIHNPPGYHHNVMQTITLNAS